VFRVAGAEEDVVGLDVEMADFELVPGGGGVGEGFSAVGEEGEGLGKALEDEPDGVFGEGMGMYIVFPIVVGLLVFMGEI
jgi:hypothetical protein